MDTHQSGIINILLLQILHLAQVDFFFLTLKEDL